MITNASTEHPMPFVASRTRNGKIARLPQAIREQLNRRLDDGEPGKRLVGWINSLPEAQAVFKLDFGGRVVSEQNLSEWKQGGYRDWQKQQERLATVRQLTQDSNELGADAGGVEVGNHLSAVLVAELAASARDSLAAITDPAERSARVQEFLQTLVRVRRQDNQAGRLAIERERRSRERVEENEKDASRKEWAREWEPVGRHFKRSFMGDLYAKPDFTSQLMATQDAESLLRGVKLDGSCSDGSTAPVNPGPN
jgi:hypothetical protein